MKWVCYDVFTDVLAAIFKQCYENGFDLSSLPHFHSALKFILVAMRGGRVIGPVIRWIIFRIDFFYEAWHFANVRSWVSVVWARAFELVRPSVRFTGACITGSWNLAVSSLLLLLSYAFRSFVYSTVKFV